MADELKKYVKELGEMLKKRDYKLVDDFIMTHKKFYSPLMITQWKNANEKVKKLTYIKMVEKRTDMDKETKEYAEKLRREIYV